MYITEVKLTRKTEQEFLPKLTSRRPRVRYIKCEYVMKLPTVQEAEFPVAMYVIDGIDGIDQKREEIRLYNGTLYRRSNNYPKAKDLPRVLRDQWGIREHPEYVEGTSVILSTHTEEVEKEIAEAVSDFLICVDNVWYPTDEPRYVVVTGGFGHNHGYTGLMIDYSCYRSHFPGVFNALQRDEAIAYAKKVALGRGDTDYVDSIGKYENIEVLIPEAIKFDRVMDSPEPLYSMCLEGLRMYEAIGAETTPIHDIRDADTILADILPSVVGETGVGAEVLRCWKEAKYSSGSPQKSAEKMFEILTGVSLPEYIERVYKETQPKL